MSICLKARVLDKQNPVKSEEKSLMTDRLNTKREALIKFREIRTRTIKSDILH